MFICYPIRLRRVRHRQLRTYVILSIQVCCTLLHSWSNFCGSPHRIYFGPARLITKSYYVCEDKLSQLQLSGPGERPLYICEEDAVIEPFEPSEATSTPSETTQTPTQPPSVTTQQPTSTTQPPSVTTQRPTGTTQPPSVTTQRPTEPPTIAGGISECPRDSSSFRQSNYIYSSL